MPHARLTAPLLAALTLAAGAAWATAPTSKDGGATGDNYSVTLAAEPLVVGADGTATVTFKVTGGLHWNKEYPAKVTIADGALTRGVARATKRELKQLKGDFEASEHVATAKIPLKGVAPGKDTLRVDTRFSICSDRVCLIKQASAEVELVVTP